MAARIPGGHVPIERLRGRENYHTWAFAMRAYLEIEDLWRTIEPQVPADAEEDAEPVIDNDPDRNRKAKAKIILSLDPIVYGYVQEAITAKDAWDSLRVAYEENGLSRRVTLLIDLVSTKLENCESEEDYINKVTTTAHKLREIEMDIPDEWIGAILLAGLPQQYQPMIMAISGSGVEVTADYVKTRIIQDIKFHRGRQNQGATTSGLFVQPGGRRGRGRFRRGHSRGTWQNGNFRSSNNNNGQRNNEGARGNNSDQNIDNRERTVVCCISVDVRDILQIDVRIDKIITLELIIIIVVILTVLPRLTTIIF